MVLLLHIFHYMCRAHNFAPMKADKAATSHRGLTFIPEDLLHQLEYDKILELVAQACVGQAAAVRARIPSFDTRRGAIVARLSEVHEMKCALAQDEVLPINAYDDISEDLRQLAIEEYVLPEEALVRIWRILRTMRDLVWFFSAVRRNAYPRLAALLTPLAWDDSLIEAISQILDEEGQIRPNASAELARIHRAILSKHSELDRQFRHIVQALKQKGWLTDNAESIRNGRRVLSVPAEHKRKIRGIIHDESTTGKTAYIEPEQVIEINNDIFELQVAERREKWRLLRDLCRTLRPHVHLLGQYQALIIRYDLILAKARVALRMNAHMPKVRSEPRIDIQFGRHPLLYLKNKAQGKETVPFDLRLTGDKRILVLSGPNAGGKSVLMKAVGLLQLMLQSGMLVPTDETSEMGIFHKIFADIGDQQSLEDDLSTYSSHLKNMREFLAQADAQTLVLIDEFGSGTDPKMGGAIAEAILAALDRKKVYGIVTTHYSNLKIFAFKTPGLLNGAMTFEKDTLSPTYQLRAGRPGSSYAFEIAQKSGLPPKIIAHAKKRTGKSEQAVDQLLVDLQREMQETQALHHQLKEKERKLQHLIDTYDRLFAELEWQRKKFKLQTKEQQLQAIAQEQLQLQKLIKEIKAQQNLEKARALAQSIQQQRHAAAEQVKEIRQELYANPPVGKKKKQDNKPLQVGDYVRMRDGELSGQIIAINNKKAIVAAGHLRLTIPVAELERTQEPLELQRDKSINIDTAHSTQRFDNKLDIRGMRYEEALEAIQAFVDQALIHNAHTIQIVHGKGTGTLRKAVHMKLSEYDAVKHIWHPEPEQGGEGITFAALA